MPASKRNLFRIVAALTILGVGLLVFPLAITLIAPRLIHSVWATKWKTAAMDVQIIAEQLHLYMADNSLSQLPAGTKLAVLSSGSNPLLNPNDLIDPWGQPYVLVVPGVKHADFDIVSYRRDGVPGGSGDDADIGN